MENLNFKISNLVSTENLKLKISFSDLPENLNSKSQIQIRFKNLNFKSQICIRFENLKLKFSDLPQEKISNFETRFQISLENQIENLNFSHAPCARYDTHVTCEKVILGISSPLVLRKSHFQHFSPLFCGKISNLRLKIQILAVWKSQICFCLVLFGNLNSASILSSCFILSRNLISWLGLLWFAGQLFQASRSMACRSSCGSYSRMCP